MSIIIRRASVIFTCYTAATLGGFSFFLQQTELQFCFIGVLPSGYAVLYYMRDAELFLHSFPENTMASCFFDLSVFL